MNLTAMTSRLVSVATLGLICAFIGLAGPISVTNFSFETLPGGGLPNGCGTDCSYSIDAIPGWVNGGNSGQFQPGPPATLTYFTTLSNGPTNAYSNDLAPISQTVGTTVQQGVTYTLMVDLGSRNDLATFTSGADLLIGGIHYAATGTAPTVGNWSTFTATYVGLAGDVGKAITIELLTSASQGNFDNVRLSSTVPEPAGVTLIGLGLAGLLAFARRKRAS